MKQSDLEAKQWNNTRFCIFLIIWHDQCEVLQVFVFGSKWSIAALKSKGEVYECITRITGSLTRKLEQRKPSKAPCKPNFASDVSLICIITIILIIVIVIIILEDLNFFLFVPLEGRRPSAAPNTCTAAKAIHPNSLHTCKYFCLVSLNMLFICVCIYVVMPPKKEEKQGSSNTDSSECTLPHLTFSPNHYNHYSAIPLLLFSVLAPKCLHKYIALKYSAKQNFQNWYIFRSSALCDLIVQESITHLCFSLQLSCMNAWEF